MWAFKSTVDQIRTRHPVYIYIFWGLEMDSGLDLHLQSCTNTLTSKHFANFNKQLPFCRVSPLGQLVFSTLPCSSYPGLIRNWIWDLVHAKHTRYLWTTERPLSTTIWPYRVMSSICKTGVMAIVCKCSANFCFGLLVTHWSCSLIRQERDWPG